MTIGDRYNKLTVVSIAEHAGTGRDIYYRCKCDCGKEAVIRNTKLINSQVISCGCYRKRKLHHLGTRVGQILLIQALNEKTACGSYYWLGLCKCGKLIKLTTRGSTERTCKDCGYKRMAKTHVTHGLSTKTNKGAYTLATRRYIKQACPNWVNKYEIIQFYADCPLGYEVDHIVPLRGKYVCGLHVLKNLQYLDKSSNRKKYNKFIPYVV